MPEYYEIKIKGHLDPHWSDWFTGMNLTQLEDDGTLISGVLPDQAALFGLLERIRDLNLSLVSVDCKSKFSMEIGKLSDSEKGTTNE